MSQEHKQPPSEEERLVQFVEANKSAEYILDAHNNTMCRTTPEGQLKCIQLNLEQKEMFSLIQKLDFFCQLSSDPNKTHMICQKF
ncbi:hypothetical protein K493DRAFT_320380 [Basidiobolus meristosporus CBS 931.73]|uniref:Uncharacterized protein n=1 Tax=Basidiobolus meristosporus CBS 931.73 TaxID=1314790 RepID=A0A1Y1XAL3_9FUNG|nr:hypothetical protein K493DRAFT_320380 [Basidiobolus meristosporus CBS 931.73]|eukprot:ORX82795.1 hypothetical protein K493DRAFT_320380 [Basidiobolus meristosporus CBS 931.73]